MGTVFILYFFIILNVSRLLMSKWLNSFHAQNLNECTMYAMMAVVISVFTHCNFVD